MKAGGSVMNRVGGLSGVQPIERSVLSDKVSKVISDGLLEGRFQPGDRLVENELAELLGVSRSPIREALTELANSGLIERQPGRGAAIREWSVKDLEDLFSVRILLEGEAVRLIYEMDPAPDLAVLDDIIGRMKRAASAIDYGRMIDLDLEFHRALWHLAGNRLLEQVLRGLSQQFRLFLTLNWRFHGGIENVAGNHERIVLALREGPDARVKDAIADHVVVESMTKALRAQAAERSGAEPNRPSQ